MARLALPSWLRRALEAALLATAVAVLPQLPEIVEGPGRGVLPIGPGAALFLAPAILALAVITAAYPVALAASRSDAVLGSIAAFLIAADATLVLAGASVPLRGGGEVPSGLLAAAAAVLPALAGLAAGQLGTALGFGRRAGAISAIVGAIGAVVAVAALAALL